MKHKAVLLVFLWCLLYRCTEGRISDFKVITTVRHGLENALNYIENNLYGVTVDCLLGVSFARGLLYSAYNNGSHIMDKSTSQLLQKANSIIDNGRLIFEGNRHNGNDWKFKNLVENNIWSKVINYTDETVLSFWSNPHLVAKYKKEWNTALYFLKMPNTDKCLQEIINSTDIGQPFQTSCILSRPCWKMFLRGEDNNGYFFTHKLLILETAKARKCHLDEHIYYYIIQSTCASIMVEILKNNPYNSFSEHFDLFLEQVLLCGYAGFTDFIQIDWLFKISKSQHLDGCFADDMTDKLKSRIKREFKYFNDGCNDHTTGLGAAVYALYYNYLVNMVSMNEE